MKDLRVVVVDYESGNLRSVSRALERAGVRSYISSNPDELREADAAVLPGVGAGDAAMEALEQRGLVEPLREYVASGKPFLAVCVGLQLLMDSTAEGDVECLGIIPGRTKKLPPGLKVPHMGWNEVNFTRCHPVFAGIPAKAHFYFVHSYYADPEDGDVVAGLTDHGISFCSAVVRDNLVGTQFHPEKSGTQGLMVYENFVKYARLLEETEGGGS